MMLDDVGAKIAGAGLGLSLDTNLFLGRMPEQPIAAVAIIEIPGLSAIRTMGGGIQIEIAGFQVMVRDEPDNYAEARSTANGIWNLLAGTTQEAINTVTYHQFVAQSSVFSIGPNEEDHIQVACNFLVWKDPTP